MRPAEVSYCARYRSPILAMAARKLCSAEVSRVRTERIKRVVAGDAGATLLIVVDSSAKCAQFSLRWLDLRR